MVIIDIIMYFLIFMMGAFLGSFCSRAIYRMPLQKKLIREKSFCPKCKHDLKIKELIPIFSYIFLRGKCKYCKQKINPRYIILEICSGVILVSLAILVKNNIMQYNLVKVVQLVFIVLYILTLIIIAGIDKEKRRIEKSVIIFGLIILSVNILCLYIIEHVNIYKYVICLAIMLILVAIDTYLLTKKAQNNYYIQILILCMYILLFSTEDIFIVTIIYAIIEMIIYKIIKKILNRKKQKVTDKKKKQVMPIGFYLCITNIVVRGTVLLATIL